MKGLTERQELERKIFLNRQAIPQVSEPVKDFCRKQIAAMRRKMWELADGESKDAT